jgi:hypothetical protein
MTSSWKSRTRRIGLAGPSLLLAAACATIGPPRPGRDGEIIRYETEGNPFCIVCRHIAITVASDRHGWISLTRRRGDGQGWEVVQRPLLLPRARLAAFRDRLAPFRPRGELDLRGPRGCQTFLSDAGGVRVEWDDGRRIDRLLFYDGCDPDLHRAKREALENAPALLGVDDIATIPARRQRFR